MKEFSKSFGSFVGAMTVFGARQLSNVITSPPFMSGQDKATTDLNTVARIAAEQSGPTLNELYQAGDHIQRQLLDMAFTFSSAGLLGNGGGSLQDMWGRTAEQMKQWAAGACRSCGSAANNAAQSAANAGQPVTRPRQQP